MAQPETRLQKRSRMFLDKYLAPPAYWSSVGRERKQSPRQGQEQNARGFKRGLPDIMLWAPSYFLAVELKSQTGRMQPDQHAFQAKMAALGHGYAVVRSVEQLGEALQNHGIGMLWGWRQGAQLHDAALDGVAPARKKPARNFPQKPTRKAVAAGNAASLFMARGGK
jgi:hypothetical protein